MFAGIWLRVYAFFAVQPYFVFCIMPVDKKICGSLLSNASLNLYLAKYKLGEAKCEGLL